tara:strand:- start:3410 stop:3679 length:270 start_codon:yes stop_codon:yes gene_type:complete
MEAAILKDLMTDIGKVGLPQGDPNAVGIKVQEVEAIPLEEGEQQADPWPMVHEKLEAIKSQFDELASIISKSYYPEEKRPSPKNKKAEY